MLHTAMSDLFFNYSHDGWRDLHTDPKKPPTQEQLEATIRQDAVEFSALMGALGVTVDPEELVSDFFARV